MLTVAPPGKVTDADISTKSPGYYFSAPGREMAGLKPKTNWGNVGAGAAAGLMLPSVFGMFGGGGGGGGGGIGEVISLLPLLLLGGGALYAVQVFKQK